MKNKRAEHAVALVATLGLCAFSAYALWQGLFYEGNFGKFPREWSQPTHPAVRIVGFIVFPSVLFICGAIGFVQTVKSIARILRKRRKERK